jgi:pimeloyl-ACP methyl ester carboxylesterase
VTAPGEHVELDGIAVEYELVGNGEPVVLPHARPFVTWYEPLAALLGDHAVLRYRRAAPDDPAFGIADDAALCARLLDRLGMVRPHVVGHSYGALVALELARQGSVELRSLALLEPTSIGLVPPDEAADRAAPLLGAAETDGPEVAMDLFLRAVCGPDGPDVLDRLLPGARVDAAAHADRFFGVELPGAVRWSFAAADAAGIGVPVLHASGADSAARFAAGAELVQEWFPDAQHHVLPGTGHFMMVQVPEAAAELLERFWRSAP